MEEADHTVLTPYSMITSYDSYNRSTTVNQPRDTTFKLMPNCRALIPTGFKMGLPLGFKFHICARSGLSTKRGIMVTNAPGKIDRDYIGVVYMTVINVSSVPFEIHHGMRIAQGSLESSLDFNWVPVDELMDTERGEGGFGHTGE